MPVKSIGLHGWSPSLSESYSGLLGCTAQWTPIQQPAIHVDLEVGWSELVPATWRKLARSATRCSRQAFKFSPSSQGCWSALTFIPTRTLKIENGSSTRPSRSWVFSWDMECGSTTTLTKVDCNLGAIRSPLKICHQLGMLTLLQIAWSTMLQCTQRRASRFGQTNIQMALCMNLTAYWSNDTDDRTKPRCPQAWDGTLPSPNAEVVTVPVHLPPRSEPRHGSCSGPTALRWRDQRLYILVVVTGKPVVDLRSATTSKEVQ
mmetsp:Transcript_36152/g.95266  ORF Transcript_36152/g.95266 Transcript_36152/m.95266 type:complete len:261 (-) Transcript_36152:95-877(-)